MPVLYLIRHAKSSWKNPELEDSQRPLNSRGERDAPEMAERLKARSLSVDLMISSPALRAKRTAQIIARALDYSSSQIKYDWELYHAGSNLLFNIMNKIPDRFSSVCLFGHNPGFTYFANALGGLDIYNIPTSGVVCLEFSEPWSKIKEGNGKLVFFDYPKKPKE